MKNGTPFKSSVTYSARSGRLKNFDLEGFLVVVSAAIGMFVEIIAACIMRGKPIGMGNIQHATMYFFFGLGGILSVLQPSLIRPFPEMENLRYIALALAIAVEAVLFKFHLYGRDEMDILVHTLLLYVCYISIIVTLLEMKYRESVLAALSRAYFFLIQGTWFWQVGFILYNPLPGAKEWDSENHHQLMMVVSIFSWHMGVILIGMMGTGFLICCLYSRKGQYPVTNFGLGNVDNGYAALLDQSEDTLE